MTRIEKVKQKAILDVAESLGYSFKRLSGQVFKDLSKMVRDMFEVASKKS
ncbi:UNVERIFIED_CONTAM: hypothetical protein KB574_08955 [Streptococcus canis]